MRTNDVSDSLDGSHNPEAGELLTDGGPMKVDNETEIGREVIDVIDRHINYLEERELEHEKLDKAYKDIREEHGDVLDDQITSIRELRDSYRELMDDHIEELEELREEQERLEERGPSGGRDMMEDRIQELEEFKVRYQGLLDEYDELQDEHEELQEDYDHLFDEYSSLHRNHKNSLKSMSNDKEGYRNRNIAEGAILTGIGLITAELYSSTLGIAEFYLNSPSIFADAPGLMIPTLGFPAAGAYMFAKAYDEHLDSEELDRKARELRKQEKLDELRREKE